MEKQMSGTSIIHQYLMERGVGFTFTANDLVAKAGELGIVSETPDGVVGGTLNALFKEQRLSREKRVGENKRPMFYYTVLPEIDRRRATQARPNVQNRTRKSGYTANHDTTPARRTASQLIDEIIGDLAELQTIVQNPLDQYTSVQLIAELHRRSGVDAGLESLVKGKNDAN